MDEDAVRKTTCQLCGVKDKCEKVVCDTQHLHRKGRNLTGHMGMAELSVCVGCKKTHKLSKRAAKKKKKR